MQKNPTNSKIQKNDGHLRDPHPQISLKQFCENVVYFLLLCRGGGWKNDKGFLQNRKILKN